MLFLLEISFFMLGIGIGWHWGFSEGLEIREIGDEYLQVLKDSLILLLLNIFIWCMFLWAWFLQNPVPAKIILGKMI